MDKSFQESDIREGVAAGGRLGGVFIICRPENRGGGWVLYIRTSWSRGYRPLRTFRNKADRVFKDLNRLVLLIRNDFQYSSEISLFTAGDENLRRYRTILSAERPEGASEEKTVLDGDPADFPPSNCD